MLLTEKSGSLAIAMSAQRNQKFAGFVKAIKAFAFFFILSVNGVAVSGDVS